MLVVICTAYLSCKKDAAAPNSTAFNIQYRVVNAKNSITSISYTGPDGDTVTGDPKEQSDTLWSKVITVKNRPFKANLTAVLSNTSTGSIDVFLQIYDGALLVNQVERSIPPGATTDGSVVYSVN